MRVLLSGAPTGLVKEHVEQKVIITHVQLSQLMVEIRTIEETSGDEIVLNTFVLEAAVDHFNLLEVVEGETDELEGRLAAIERDD